MSDADWTLTIARIVLGVIFFAHGAQKLLGWFGGAGLKTTVHDMRNVLGLPALAAVIVAGAEFLGGAGLIVGLLSRVAALGILVLMLAAILMVHGRHGLFMDWFGNRSGHGVEYHLLAIALATVIIVDGAGAWSFDRLLYRWMGA